MKKIIKCSFFMAMLSGIGLVAYWLSSKFKELKDYYENTVFFNGKALKYNGEVFEGGSYAIMFGGLEVDLTGAILEGDTNLELYGEFCGISIKVPRNWNIRLVGCAEKAGVSNKTEFDEESENTPVFTIEYDIKYAGLEVVYEDYKGDDQ